MRRPIIEGYRVSVRRGNRNTLTGSGLPDSQGLDTLLRTQEKAPQIPVIVLTGLDDETVGIKAVQEGAQDYLVKGQVSPNLLARSIRYAIERHEMMLERNNMQEQLNFTERLASIGKMASGVAHEINNPLVSVVGFAQMLLDSELPDDVKEDIAIIHRDAQRASTVANNLLAFSKTVELQKKRMNINELLEKTIETRTYEHRSNNIEVALNLAQDLPEIMGDYSHLQQVLLNIIINAEHSMVEAQNGGNLNITTELLDDNVKISIADNGLGIRQKNLGHVFDPFFTTREVGEGMGLGLSICHGIVTQHDGKIYVESEVGQGSTFIIELPVASDKKPASNDINTNIKKKATSRKKQLQN
jgi:signal transduction histidine kinase